jgi:hypothetical protein
MKRNWGTPAALQAFAQEEQKLRICFLLPALDEDMVTSPSLGVPLTRQPVVLSMGCGLSASGQPGFLLGLE